MSHSTTYERDPYLLEACIRKENDTTASFFYEAIAFTRMVERGRKNGAAKLIITAYRTGMTYTIDDGKKEIGD